MSKDPFADNVETPLTTALNLQNNQILYGSVQLCHQVPPSLPSNHL